MQPLLAPDGYISWMRPPPLKNYHFLGKLTTWRACTSCCDATLFPFLTDRIRRRFWGRGHHVCRFATSRRPDNWFANLDRTGTWRYLVSSFCLPLWSDGPTKQSLPLCALVKNSIALSLPQSRECCACLLTSQQCHPPSQADLCTAGRTEGKWFTATARRATLQNKRLHCSAHLRASLQ